MSGAHEHEQSHPPAEEDVLPSRRIVMVGVLALFVFFLGSLAAGLGLRAVRREANPDGPPPLPSEAGRAKIGLVEQRLFEHSNMGAVWREAARRRLESYGWVDRQKGIAHVPIERAMDMIEKGVRP